MVGWFGRYELEIRQRHDKIEKKQIYIARLNRRFEQLVSSQEDENTGPLEATIKNLQKEMKQINKDSAAFQRDWIRTQTELVTLAQATSGEQEKVTELQVSGDNHVVLIFVFFGGFSFCCVFLLWPRLAACAEREQCMCFDGSGLSAACNPGLRGASFPLWC